MDNKMAKSCAGPLQGLIARRTTNIIKVWQERCKTRTLGACNRKPLCLSACLRKWSCVEYWLSGLKGRSIREATS
jgi:hypothetical protein